MSAALIRKLTLTAVNASMDSTGVESTTLRAYDQLRSGCRRSQNVKLSVVNLGGVLVIKQWALRRQARSTHIVDTHEFCGPQVYEQRWHIDTFTDGMKRRTNSHLASRKSNTIDTDSTLRFVASAL